MRIMTTHDVFRSSVFNLPDPEESIGPWFWQWVTPHLTQLGHRTDRFTLMKDGTPKALIAAAANLPRDIEGWTYLFSDPRALDTAAALIAPLLDADMVIGFEMPPNMIRVLSRMGKRFLDLGQDPIRFCPDLFLRVRGNDPALARKLTGWIVPDSAIQAAAGALKTRLGGNRDRPSGVLFAGQMPIDSSLIATAAVAHAGSFFDRIEQRVNGRDLLLKPHPSAPNSPDLIALYQRFPDARFIDDNIYALLSHAGIEDVVTLSSSVATEAPYFGKTALPLINADHLAISPDAVSAFHRIDARVGTTAFWGALIDDLPAFMFVEAPARPLRQRFSVSWGFASDMDAIVRRQVAEGETIDFHASGRGPALCLFGWSEPEPWGIWSDGEAALLQFVPDPRSRQFVAKIALVPHVPKLACPLHVTVQTRAGGANDSRSFTFRTNERTEIEIPITMNDRSGVMELMFRITNPARPPNSADQRRLGIGLHQMELQASPRMMNPPPNTRSPS